MIFHLCPKIIKYFSHIVLLLFKKYFVHSKIIHILVKCYNIYNVTGYEGLVYCLDSAPGVFRKQFATIAGNTTEEELQNAVAEQIYKLMAHEDSELLKIDLRQVHTWKDKVDVTMNHVSGRIPYSMQYARLQLESAYGRICAANNYDPTRLFSRPLKSQLVLIKGRSLKGLDYLPEDYGLSKYSLLKPIIYQLDSDHRSIPLNLHCSNIVNRHLGEEIHEQFAHRNLCDTYLDNPTKFMGISDTVE